MKVLLVCAAGISTSVLMRKLEAHAAAHGVEPFEVRATGVRSYAELCDRYDCILVGPQSSYALDEVRAISSKPCAVIDAQAYGSGDCEAIFKLVADLLEPDEENSPKEEGADMSALDSFAESKFMQGLQKVGQKMQANPAVQAITGGMMGTMNLILAGAVFTVLASVLSLIGVISQDGLLYQQLMVPYNMTMNIMSVAIAFCVGYAYTKNLKMGGEMANGIVSMVLFLMVAAPVSQVTLADGSTMSALDSSMLGGTGIFTAMIIPIVAVKIIAFCQSHNVTIKMPESIPPFLADSFATLVPLVINIVLWRGLAFVCEHFMGASLPGIVMGLLSAPLGVFASGPGIVVLGILCMVFWFFGMHGTGIVYIVIMPLLMQAMATNAELFAAGQSPVFDSVFLFSAFACCGGTGNVLPLSVLCLRSKSEQLKAVGKAGLVPACFNISEPMIFGTPLMYNTTLAIPFILNGVFIAVAMWVGYAIGFLQPAHILIMTVMPIFVGDFLGAMAWQNVLVPIVAFVIAYLCYAPFVRMYDKQLCEKEAAERAEAEAQQAA